MDTRVSQAIIMRIREFGESDLLVTFFTSDRGRLKGVAKGGRKSRKRFANCLDLFCLTNLEYGLKRKGDLYFLNSGKLLHAFPGLRSNFYSLSLASYMIELTEILFPQNVADKRMFELLKESFFAFDEGRRNDVLRIIFEAKAMVLGGYGINFDRCCTCGRQYTGVGRAVFKQSRGGIVCLNCEQESGLCPGMEPDAVKGMRAMQSGPWDELDGISLTEDAIRQIKPVLKLHIEYRIGKKLKSSNYLE
ncbi:MAG: DNA repair protein RecO [Deltaproteobacteria bacterium]|nr:DNA repair protein RecO [Deltaproteobacteria bacterium]